MLAPNIIKPKNESASLEVRLSNLRKKSLVNSLKAKDIKEVYIKKTKNGYFIWAGAPNSSAREFGVEIKDSELNDILALFDENTINYIDSSFIRYRPFPVIYLVGMKSDLWKRFIDKLKEQGKDKGEVVSKWIQVWTDRKEERQVEQVETEQETEQESEVEQ